MKLVMEKMIYGGAALARHEGKAVFVQGALPGEVVEAELTKQKPGFAEARLVAVVEAAPERVEPGCRYYGACGGCQYQHAAYTAQVAIKRAILEETLGRAGLRTLPEIGVHTAEPWGYRNRIRLHVDPRTHAVGYLRRLSRELLAVESCPIAAPVLEQGLRALQGLAPAHRLGAWCAEVELFTSGDLSQVLLQIQGRGAAEDVSARLQRLCRALREELPQLSGAEWSVAEEPTRGLRGSARKPRGMVAAAVRWGEPSLEYRAAGHVYRVSAGSFFQANRLLVDRLARLAREAERGETAWDLFAGVGLFSRLLAERFAHVTAVEGAPGSSGDLRENLQGHTVRSQSTLSFLREQNARGGLIAPDRIPPDLVVLDPPRAGLGSEAAEALASIRSRAVTYVSCDPATLARDLAALVHAGYTLTALELVDMFPQTFHLETVARLRLG